MLCRGKRCVFGVQCKNRKERERRKKKSVSECVRVSDMTARRFRIVNIWYKVNGSCVYAANDRAIPTTRRAILCAHSFRLQKGENKMRKKKYLTNLSSSFFLSFSSLFSFHPLSLCLYIRDIQCLFISRINTTLVIDCVTVQSSPSLFRSLKLSSWLDVAFYLSIHLFLLFSFSFTHFFFSYSWLMSKSVSDYRDSSSFFLFLFFFRFALLVYTHTQTKDTTSPLSQSLLLNSGSCSGVMRGIWYVSAQSS